MSAPTLLPRPAWLPRERWPFPTGALATAVGQIAFTDVGEGPTLLFVHVGSWSFIWRDLLVALSPHHRCVALDAPGSGLSSHPDSVVGLESAALAVSAVIDELDLREITLVMHDVGGPVGLAAAARQPDRIAGLVALNALGWRPTGAALRGMLAVMGSAPIRESAALLGWAARLSASAFGAGREWTNEDRAVFLTGMDRPSRRNTHCYLRALRTENDLLQRAEAALRGPLSRLPLLTVFGSRNDPFKLGQKWKQLFPDAEQHTIPGGNHYPMGDNPAGVSTLIRRWHSTHLRGAHQPQRAGSRPAQKSR
ncbi:MAG TPA: alpha/beta fold hydrolase [Pseudonocardiaceae bacterium]|nr:alpha/beta fold hydrolase [Pseudonocardiaceae bacterium]